MLARDLDMEKAIMNSLMARFTRGSYQAAGLEVPKGLSSKQEYGHR